MIQKSNALGDIDFQQTDKAVTLVILNKAIGTSKKFKCTVGKTIIYDNISIFIKNILISKKNLCVYVVIFSKKHDIMNKMYNGWIIESEKYSGFAIDPVYSIFLTKSKKIQVKVAE